MKAAKEVAREELLTSMTDEEKAKFFVDEAAISEQAKKKKTAELKAHLEKKRDEAKAKKAAEKAATVNEEL